MAVDLWRCGLGLIQVEILEQEGYHSLEDLAAATDEELLHVPGIGHFKLRIIRRVAPHVPAEPYQIEELGDDLSTLPGEEAGGREHED